MERKREWWVCVPMSGKKDKGLQERLVLYVIEKERER